MHSASADRRAPALAAPILLAVIGIAAAPARIDRGLLQPGATVEGHMEAAQVHVYRIAAEAGDYVRVRLEQRGLDLALAVKAPDGRAAGDFHDPDVVDRPERWSFLAVEAGEYAL